MKLKSSLWMSVVAVALAILWLPGILGAATGSGYHVIQTYKIGGDGGWDYLTVEPEARRLYISRGHACHGH